MAPIRHSQGIRKNHSYASALSGNSSDDVSNFSENLEHGTDSESDAKRIDTKPRKTRRKRRKIKAEPENAQEGQVVKPGRPDKYVRGRRGHLKLMTEMPIDTLHEIFRQLDPLDLLYLSWANKSLRGIVLEKSARYIWEEVYERLYESSNPPPRCPEDVNFVQYTRFLYYKKCMICHIRNGPYTCWMMRLRTCYHCLVNSDQFFVPDDFDPGDEWSLAIHARQTTFVFANDVESPAESTWASHIEFEKRSTLRKGKKDFDAWEERCSDERLKDLERRKTERKAAIFKKLGEIGWDESKIKEINEGRLSDDLPGFGTAKKLTKKDWNDVRPKIEEMLSQMKQDHLARLKRQRLEKRWNDFETKFKEWDQTQTLDPSFRPHTEDISVLEPFRTIIFISDTEGAEFKIDDIDRVAKEWIEWRDNFLFNLLPVDLQDRYQANKRSLQPLAIFRFSGISSFRFSGVSSFRFYGVSPDNATLDSVCAGRENLCSYVPQTSDERKIHEAFTQAKLSYTGPWQWANQRLRFETEGFEIAVEVLKFLGMDPYTTTLTQVAEYQQMHECPKCEYGGLFSCKDMMQHDWEWHYAEIKKGTPLANRWIRPEDDNVSGPHSD